MTIQQIEEKRTELRKICEQYRVKNLEIFGSTARGDADDTTSDLDFLVEFLDSGWQGAFKRYMGLLFALEELFGVHVDLVKTKAIANPYFKMTVDRDRKLVYAA